MEHVTVETCAGPEKDKDRHVLITVTLISNIWQFGQNGVKINENTETGQKRMDQAFKDLIVQSICQKTEETFGMK